jgi:methionine sulfoxide reductase heme-binding subunit
MPFLREKSGRVSPEKIAALAIAIAPALWLAGLVALDQLGARPVMEALHFLGRTTVRLILASLLITPARRILNWNKLINARRTLGVAAACYAACHFTLFIVDQKFDLAKVASEVALRFYLTLGFITLSGLIALGVTSTDAAVRRLGARWGTLHQAVYLIGALAVVHFALQKKLDIYEPTLMMGLLAWLLAYRALHKWQREVGLAGLFALALFATLFTMLFEALWYGALTGVPFARVIALNFMFMVDIRPAWWVCAASLAVIVVYIVAQNLWPRAPARLKLYPAE